MSRVLTNNVSLAFAVEASIGVLPASPEWRTLQPNNINAFGATITTTPRSPISPDRGRKKGTVTDLDSTVEFEEDLTMQALDNFAEGFVFAEYANVEFVLRSGGATPVPPPATGTGYTIDSASALLAGKVQWAAGAAISLVYAQGYALAANNGLKALTADLAGSGVEITVSGLSVETPPTSASLQVAGMQSDDCTFTISGSTCTLVSAADLDFTTMGIHVGQLVHLGSNDGAGAVQNAMQDATANDTFGYFRVTAVTATTLSGDKLDVNLGSGGSPYTPGTLDIMYGRFLRNVTVTADADDNRYLERSYQFEVGFPDLGGAGVDEYEYGIGCEGNELGLDLPLADKAGLTWGFVGTNADDITPTRKTNAATPIAPLRTTAVNTSADIATLSTDLLSAVGNVCFKSLTLSLNNNVSPEKCLGTLGAVFVNNGLFEVNLEAQLLFTEKSIVNAVKNNTTITFSAIMKNEDGAIAFDIPAMTLSGGDREYPVGESVLVNFTGEAFNDPSGTIPNVSLGISLFASVPTVR